MLDMGCGFGEFLKYLVGKGVACFGIDSNAAHVAMCNEFGLVTQVGNILDFRSEKKFENAILDNVLEHLDQNEIALFFGNIRNVLTPKGRLIVIVPCLKGQSKDPTHKTYVTKDLISNISSKHGIKLIEMVKFLMCWELGITILQMIMVETNTNSFSH